ncbi:hypothetical protein EJ06DRAFT_207395 [Trichodelitschia bisporula]|uniref:Zn(2)-C6 fungal-type domain-containing protein n=1 Tax=Trichodelitschia bisporula TaxID=703511 RepID=A0A6G1I8K7_9PEZI|nr:hypothetical protein EJ06DRAFT_207395 [Trichodelitschia bisporula]
MAPSAADTTQPDASIVPSTEKEHSDQNSSSSKRQKSRHRASVACASCRDRRIRCVVPPGETECTQCKRSGIECIIKNDDERRRPISRAYMCSLTDRVALLESMLREAGSEPPPANHPPMTRHGPPRIDDPSPARKVKNPHNAPASNPSGASHSSPGSQHDDFMDAEGEGGQDGGSVHSAPSPPMLPPPRRDGMVSRLLSTRGHLSFDQLSGRLRYFGPTTNCHIHTTLGGPPEESSEGLEQVRRAEKTIRYLSGETHEYLMELFWTYYNSVLHVLHKDAFYEDREQGRTQFYSPFLHICVLAMGYRFADKTRPDMQRISMPGRESTLHREAKYMMDFELERPGGIPSVVALLLLGDLECGVGRDNLGWLYAGIAVRIAFDIGLHLDTQNTGLPDREVEIRRMTLWACVIYDKYWALFLGRPTSMKSSDLEVYHLSKQFERLGTCRPAGPEKALETQIYEALLDLMELAGKITENMDPRSQADATIDRDAYLRMAALDREFGNWYARLPEPLRWTPHNINTAPFSFFLLHQQYHAALILLHRPFAMYEDTSDSHEESNSPDNHFSALSRTVCTKHAIRVARIFWQHRQRFDTRRIFVTGLQHAGTAATALVAALAFLKDATDRSNNMQYLECLTAALQDMAYTYQPAERMFLVLQAVVSELRGTTDPGGFRPRAVVPARRGSNTVDEPEAPGLAKRRHVARARGQSKSHIGGGDMAIDPALGGLKPLDEGDGFVMITPRSDLSGWPGDVMLGDTLGTPGGLSGLAAAARGGNAWMGAEMESHDIGHLASVHFPELRDIPGVGEGENGGGGGGAPGGANLDFMAIGEEWKEWNGSAVQPGSEMEGFASGANGFGGFGGGQEGFGEGKMGFAETV